MAPSNTLPQVNPGQRAIIAGRTGSGKSTLVNFLTKRSPGQWVVLNPKHTKAYSALPGAVTMHGFDLKKLEKLLLKDGVRYVIINPQSHQANMETMDLFIEYMHEHYENVGIVCDELYTLHKNGIPGDGLIGWLTRGRELKQSFIGLTQRPAWISKFLISEADYVCSMSLVLEDDRKTMYKSTGQIEMLKQLPEREWLWYTVKTNKLRHLGAVPLR